jgi:hypothetical protein
MKRLVALTAAAVLALSLAACSTAPSTADTPAETPAPTAAPTTEPDSSLQEAADVISTAEQIEVEDGLFDVTLTLPADYASDITAEEIAQQVADGKVHTGVLNDDGSVTYTMSKAQHAALLESVAAQLRSTLDDMIGSADYPTSPAKASCTNCARATQVPTSPPSRRTTISPTSPSTPPPSPAQWDFLTKCPC